MREGKLFSVAESWIKSLKRNTKFLIERYQKCVVVCRCDNSVIMPVLLEIHLDVIYVA